MHIRLFASLCASILELQYPVDFSVGAVTAADAEGTGYPADQIDGIYFGYHLGKLAHTIKVAENPCRGLYEVIAHEFAHAYVFENHENAKDHGRSFVLACRLLRKELTGFGVPVKALYLRNTDK